MTDSNYIKVFTGGFIVVQRILDELEKVGISAVVKEQNESSINPIFGGQLLKEVFVHKDELDKAVLVVEDINSQLLA